MAREINDADQFKDRLLKLIPSEIVATYVAIQGLLINQSLIVIQIIISVLTVLTFVYLRQIEKVSSLKHAIFSTVSFLIWIYAIAPESIIGKVLFNPQLASIVLILWTLLIPLVIVPKPSKT